MAAIPRILAAAQVSRAMKIVVAVKSANAKTAWRIIAAAKRIIKRYGRGDVGRLMVGIAPAYYLFL